jgi:hypothetical protein
LTLSSGSGHILCRDTIRSVEPDGRPWIGLVRWMLHDGRYTSRLERTE